MSYWIMQMGIWIPDPMGDWRWIKNELCSFVNLPNFSYTKFYITARRERDTERHGRFLMFSEILPMDLPFRLKVCCVCNRSYIYYGFMFEISMWAIGPVHECAESRPSYGSGGVGSWRVDSGRPRPGAWKSTCPWPTGLHKDPQDTAT